MDKRDDDDDDVWQRSTQREGDAIHTFMFHRFIFSLPAPQLQKTNRVKTMSSSQEPRSPFRNDILKDRVVLISGGATGIGFGCAVCFGLHGAKVA